MSVWQASRLSEGFETDRPSGGPRKRTRSLPRCPYAARGIDDDAMRSCPGFAAASLTFHGLGAGEAIGGGLTCAHLDTQSSRRGFVTACRHPGGLPAGAQELAGRLPRMIRIQPVR